MMTYLPRLTSVRVPSRRGGTIEALLCRLRQRATELQHKAPDGEPGLLKVWQLIGFAERDDRIGKPAYVVANQLGVIDTHLTVLERRHAKAVPHA